MRSSYRFHELIIHDCAYGIHVISNKFPDQRRVSDRLKDDVFHLSQVIGFRDRTHLEGLMKSARFIEESLRSATPSVQVQPFGVNGTTYENIVARFGPSEGDLIVIGAHYDAVS